MSNNGRFEYTIGYKVDDSGLKKVKEELEKIQKLTINSSELKFDLKTGDMETYSANLQNAKDAALQLHNALQNATKANGQVNASSFLGQLKSLNLKEIYTDMSKIGPVGIQAFRSMADQALKLNTYVKQGNVLLKKFGNTLYRNLEWLISGNLINSVTSIFTQAYGFTKNLDNSLNDIRIVTGKSADEMERFGKQAQKTALELSKGTTDITNASLIFFQQGLDQEEVDARTEITAKMSNVTGQSAEQIADQMTAVWNGFKAGSDELEHYADVMTAVAASTASSSAELAGSISKTASIANTTGVDMEQLTAMLSTVISVTRESPETVGTAFKTIFARINDLVEDGTDEFGVSLGRVSSHLAAMGVEILNEDGSLRELGSTLTQVGENWQSYSREQQVALAEQIGGKRQWGQVIALFDNWDKYKDALDTARESTGALQEQQDTYSERVTAHLQQLKTQWEGIYQELLDSKEIIAVVDVGKNLLTVIESIVKTAGGAVPILGSVASIMLGAFSDKIAQQILRIRNNLKMMAEAASEATLKEKVAGEFGRSVTANDTAMQSNIAYYKTANQLAGVMTKEERERINALGEAYTAKSKEVEQLASENQIITEIVDKWKNVKEYQNFSAINLEELKQKTQQVKQEAQAAEAAFKNWSPEGEGVIEPLADKKTFELKTSSTGQALTNSGKKGVSISEQDKAMWNEAKAAVQEYQKALEQLKQAEQENVKDIGVFQDQFRQAFEVAEEKMQALTNTKAYKQGFFSENAKNNIKQMADAAAGIKDTFGPIDVLKEKFKELKNNGLLSAKSIEEIENKLKTLDRTDTDQLADAWKLLSQKLKESEKDFSHLSDQTLKQTVEKLRQARTELIKTAQTQIQELDQNQVKRVTQGFTQMTSGVVQLSFGLQSLSNAWKTLNSDEATGLEKFSAMTMAILQVGNGAKTALTGLDDFASAILLDGKAIDKVVEAKNRDIAKSIQKMGVTEAEAEQTRRNAEATAEETLAKEGSAAVAQKEIIASGTNLTLKEGESIAREGNTVAIEGETVAQGTQNVVNGVARTGQALTLAGLKAIIAARLKHIATLAEEIALLAITHAPIIALIAALGSLVWGIIKVVKAKKEEKKALEQVNETYDKYKTNSESLLNTIDKELAAFAKFKDVWDSFEYGAAKIDDVREAIANLAKEINVEDDATFKKLMRIAEYTGDYSRVEEFFENRAKNQRETSTKAAWDVVNDRANIINSELAKENPLDIFGAYLNENGVESGVKRKTAINLLEDTGIIKATENNKNIIDRGVASWNDNITIESIAKLAAYKDQIQEWINSEDIWLRDLGEKYSTLLAENQHYLDEWQEKTMIALQKTAVNNLTNDLGNGDTEQQANVLAKRIRDQIESRSKEYENIYHKPLSEAQKKQLRENVLNEYADIYPNKNDIVAAVQNKLDQKEAFIEIFNQGLSDFESEMHYSLGAFSVDETDAIAESLSNSLQSIDLRLDQIDWTSVMGDRELFTKIVTQKGKLTKEDLENIKYYEKEVEDVIQLLSQDYKTLGASYDEFNKKIEKGSFSAKTFNSKAFQEFFNDDVKFELKELYGTTSEVGEAIDTLSNKALIGSKEWEAAWKIYGKAIKNAEIEQDIQNVENAIYEMDKHINKKKGDKHIFAGVDLQTAEEDINNFINADRTIDIDLRIQSEDAMSELKDSISDITKLGDAIDENLQISLDDFLTLQEEFPDIGKDMKVLADGNIRLSQSAVDAMKQQMQERIRTEVDTQIATIEIQKALLEAKKKVYKESADKALDFAEKAAKGQYDSEEALNNDISVLNEKRNEIKDIENRQARAKEIVLQQDQVDDWTKYYKNLSVLDSEWNKQRIRNAMKVTEEGVEGADELEENVKVTAKNFYIEKEDIGSIWNRTAEDTATKTYTELAQRAAEAKIANTVDLDNTAIEKYFRARHESEMKAYDDIQKEISGYTKLEDSLITIKNVNLQKASAIGKATDATKDNTDATKDNAEAQAELLDLLNEEIDVYHDLNIAIKQVNNELSSLQKQEEKLTGDALTKNLEEQNKLLEQQIQNYQELARRKTADLVSTQSYLESQGMTFDENGNMMNHDEVILNKMEEVNNLRSEYNSLSAEEQEGFKERVEAAEEEYEILKKKIDLYDELQTDTIPQALADIAEAENKIIENNIKTFDLKFQIEFDKADAEKEYREFRNKVIKDLKEDDILGNTLASYEDLSYYRNIQGTGKIQILSQELSELQQAQQDLAETGTSIFGDNAAAIEERIKSVTSELYKAQIEEKEAINAIEDQYLDAIDTVGDKIKEQIDAHSKISDLIEHDINLIKLLYGEEAATEAVQKFQQQQEKQLWQQYDMYVKWSAQAQKEMNKVEIGSDAWKKWRSQWEEAQTGIRQSLEDIAQSIIDTYTTTIDTIYQKLDEKLGGALGLESLKSTYDFMQEQADKYLDTVNGAYAIEKLSKDMQDKINATDDVKAQQRLSELKDQEIKNLREKDKLTQYDIDRANALYDIEVKKIALREAQQNKSKMRLRRDSQGNYSYQFVADEDSIATAAQELADAQNTLFNLDKDAYKNNLDEFYKLFTDFKEKQKQIYIDYADDAEKRQEALLQLEKTYGPAINGVIKQNANIRINYEKSAFEAIGELYGLNAEDLQNMADTEKDILMNQLVPNWTNGIQDMIGQIVGEGGFLAAIQEFNAELEKNVYLRKQGLGNVENVAKRQFGNDIVNGNDSIVNTMESLIDSNETIITQWATLIDELKEIVNYVVTLSKTGIRVIEDGNIAENDNQSIPIQLKNSENTTGQSTYSLDSNGYTQTTYNSIDKNKSINKTLKPKENLSPQAARFLESAQNDPTWTKADIKQALNMINFVEAHNNQKDTSKQILDSISDKVRQNITALTRMLSFDKNLNIISSIGNEVKAEPASVQQNNYINADFPNAKDVYEILLAFETLQNQATQMAYTTRR